MTRTALLLLALPFLAACQPNASGPDVNRADLAATPLETVPADACWRTDRIPALSETVFVVDATGARVPRAVVRQPAAERLFAVPCPDTMDAEFLASLQRALAVRGHFSGPISGTLDDATRDAVRRFQAPLGLNSAILSLDAAQRLGLVPVARGTF